jgi:hypothetical protein
MSIRIDSLSDLAAVLDGAREGLKRDASTYNIAASVVTCLSGLAIVAREIEAMKAATPRRRRRTS